MFSPVVLGVEDEDVVLNHSNLLFVWLDRCEKDYNEVRERFCRETQVNSRQWFFFHQANECQQFLQKAISLSRRIIFITSGSLGIELIKYLHHYEQLYSIYIYCRDLLKYQQFAQSYVKILGVFSNPGKLLVKLIENFEKEKEEILKIDDDDDGLIIKENQFDEIDSTLNRMESMGNQFSYENSSLGRSNDHFYYSNRFHSI